MPRVKFDYIVSFSSEDPEHPASNLLSWEVSKKKWLCASGETSASVVLQLDKAVQIGTVAVGAHHAALVEVLVGRSETPAEPYQVLVASCVFLSPSESRKAEGASVERVRSFTGAEGVWAQRWDRVRLFLSQPYNKHCKFGVSFVHVFSPDTVPAPPTTALDSPTPATVLARPALLTALAGLSSDEEEFKPGELFAQHKRQADINTKETDTGSQIRRASSQLLRTSSDSTASAAGQRAAVLVKAPHTPARSRRHDADVSTRNDGSRGGMETREPDGRNKRRRDSTSASASTSERDTDRKRKKHSSHEQDKARDQGAGGAGGVRGDGSARPREARYDKRKQKPASRAATAVLSGVVCVLSGYENPRRAAVRSAALALGARVLPRWDPACCTHLICAFPKTPKLRTVRSAPGGARVPAVLADWVEECARLRRRLPEEWFSTEGARRVPVPAGGLDADGDGEGEGVHSEDTDDEIERVLRGRRATSPPPPSPSPPPPTAPDAGRSADSDVEFVADARIQGSVSVSRSASGDSSDYEDTTEVEASGGEAENEEGAEAVDVGRTLPPLLRDMVFVSVGERVDRYVRAYGGTILPLEEVVGAEGGAVYALCGEGAQAPARAGRGVRRLRLRWLWRAHRDRRLPSLGTYILD